MTLRYETRYGGFSADGWQYEVAVPDPPREWTNLLVNRTFLCEVSQAGRGASYGLAPSANPVSLPHRAFFIRDTETKEYWSPTGYPAGGPLVAYRSVHRPDRSLFESERSGIGARIRVFVPVEGTVSIWTATLKNHAAERRRLSFFSYVPMVAADTRRPAESGYAARYDAALGAAVVSGRWGRPTAGFDNLCYVAARPKPDHTEGSEEAFLGGAARWDRPAALERGFLADGAGLCAPIGVAFQHDLVLDENGTWTVTIAVGCAETREALAAAAQRFTDPEAVEALFEECWAFWSGDARAVGPPWLTTPDEELNLAVNVWLKRQLAAQVWGRRWTAGVSARDVLQDAVGYLPYDAAPLRRELTEAFSRQDVNGFLPRDWSAVPPAATVRERAHRDTPVWAAWALAAYVNETGDLAFLSEPIPFRDRKKPATVLEHAVAGLRFLAEGVGQHGLCLFGEGDWNDSPEGAGAEGRGESAWTSAGLVFAARSLSPVARAGGQLRAAEFLDQAADRLARALNAAAWDGAWYVRGYTDDGRRFGTHGETEGRIYLNPQSWSILAGVPNPERSRLILESVRAHLDTEFGPVLVAPPYTRYEPRLGRLTGEIPGRAENGSVHTHAALFWASALAALGEGDRAVETFRRILPTVRQDPVERSRHLPLWMPNYYVPPGAEHAGLASTTCLTGAVPWSFIFLREYVFGVRPTPVGLRLRPCVPSNWRECRMVRPFRGDEYEIVLRNPNGLQTGRVALELDGRPIEGDLVPLLGDRRRHQVNATLLE